MDNLSTKKIRLHLADGDFLVRLGLERAIEDLDYISLESVCQTGEDAITAAVNSQPDIVLMEATLQGIDGIAATARICAGAPKTKVVMLSAAADTGTMKRAYEAGAVSYLTKSEITQDLGPALRMIHRGATILSTPLRAGLLPQNLPSAPSVRPFPIGASLTARDKDLLTGLSAGQTNAELGRALHLSEATVKAQLTGLMARLKVSNRVQLAVLGIRAGIIAE